MDRGACSATVHGVEKELDTTEQLNNNHKTLLDHVCDFQKLIFYHAMVLLCRKELGHFLGGFFFFFCLFISIGIKIKGVGCLYSTHHLALKSYIKISHFYSTM